MRGAFSSSRRNWWWPSCSKTLRAHLLFPQPWPGDQDRDTLAPTPGPGTSVLEAPVPVPRAGGGQGSASGDPKEATSTSLPTSPLRRRGTTLRPQLRVALHELWVLSSPERAAGHQEEEGSDEGRTSLILAWPTGSCVADFG